MDFSYQLGDEIVDIIISQHQGEAWAFQAKLGNPILKPLFEYFYGVSTETIKDSTFELWLKTFSHHKEEIALSALGSYWAMAEANAAKNVVNIADDVKNVSDDIITKKSMPPNPYGKLGSPEHRVKVKEIVLDIRSRGLIPETEFPIKTIDGKKVTRYIDVVARDPKTGKIVEIHQVGKSLKSKPKVPVSRERDALRDIRYSPEIKGAKRFYHEY
jgi:hypothetical protein